MDCKLVVIIVFDVNIIIVVVVFVVVKMKIFNLSTMWRLMRIHENEMNHSRVDAEQQSAYK